MPRRTGVPFSSDDIAILVDAAYNRGYSRGYSRGRSTGEKRGKPAPADTIHIVPTPKLAKAVARVLPRRVA